MESAKKLVGRVFEMPSEINFEIGGMSELEARRVCSNRIKKILLLTLLKQLSRICIKPRHHIVAT